jgi:hypothetical protein
MPVIILPIGALLGIAALVASFFATVALSALSIALVWLAATSVLSFLFFMLIRACGYTADEFGKFFVGINGLEKKDIQHYINRELKNRNLPGVEFGFEGNSWVIHAVYQHHEVMKANLDYAREVIEREWEADYGTYSDVGTLVRQKNWYGRIAQLRNRFPQLRTRNPNKVIRWASHANLTGSHLREDIRLLVHEIQTEFSSLRERKASKARQEELKIEDKKRNKLNKLRGRLP